MLTWMKLSLGLIWLWAGIPAWLWGDEIHLVAAASLKDVMNAAADNYEKQHVGVKIIRSYGASGMLAKQIEQGLEADLFVSANTEWMRYLETQGVVDARGVTLLARNTLVVAGANPLSIKTLRDLIPLKAIAMGSPLSVPAGEYAQKAMETAGIRKDLEGKLILAQDVRAALNYAALGEAEAALVYNTDLRLSPKVKCLYVVPQELHPSIMYLLGTTQRGATQKAVVAFVAYLSSAEIKSLLQTYGFLTP